MTFSVNRYSPANLGRVSLATLLLTCALILSACDIPFYDGAPGEPVTDTAGAEQNQHPLQDIADDANGDDSDRVTPQLPDEAFQHDPEDAGDQPAEPLVVVEGGLNEPRTLNPVLVDDPVSEELSRLVFSGLTRLNPDSGEPEPDLATSWEVHDDGTTWTFTIRDGLNWHDGYEFTAQDVEFTFDLMMDHRTRSPRFSRIVERVSAVEALDAQTVEFRLLAPYAPFPSTIATFGIIPQHLLSSVLPDELVAEPFGTSTAVGTGPFQLAHWSRGERIIFEAYHRHYDGSPGFDIYEFRIAADSDDLLTGLESGAIDWARISATLAEDVESLSNVELVAVPSFEMVSIVLHLDPASTVAFEDPSVRQALLYSLDRDQIAEQFWFGYAEVAHSIIPGSSWAAADPETRYEYSPSLAEEMLSDAGWVPGETWTRQRESVPLEFRLLANGDNPVRRDLVEWIAEQWRDIGVDATVEFKTWGEVRDRITTSRDFESVVIGYRWDVDPDQHAMWSSDSTATAFNLGSYINRDVDQLLEDALLTTDREERSRLYSEIQEIVLQDLPILPLVFPDQLIAVGPRLHGEEQTAILLRNRANVAAWSPGDADTGGD